MNALNNTLISTLSFVFALGIIIFVHEAGHLLVAKGFGVRVMTFSLGFGRRLWGFKRGDTEYRLSLVPLGGYVRLGGENPEEATGDPREFLSKPRWQRILVYLAGPLMNVVLATALFAGLFTVGIEVPNLDTLPSVVGGVEPGSTAAKAGLRKGDRITAVNGEPVEGWKEVFFPLITSPDRPVRLTVQRAARSFEATVVPAKDPKYLVGDTAGLIPVVRPQLTEILSGSAAEAAGFETGDEVWAVDGRPILDQKSFVEYIEPRAGRKVDIEIRRDGRTLTLPVVPREEEGKGRIGVHIGFFQRYPPGRALVAGLAYNVQIVEDTFAVLGKLFTRQLSPKGALAGPIEIAAQTGAAARTGFKHLLHLMGFISISIAILNLMPIPILDGGQIAILLVEGTIRRDLSLRLKEVITQVGFVLILLLMVVVLWFDLSKHLPAGLLPGS